MLIDEVRAVQGTRKAELYDKYKTMLENEIKAVAARGGTSVMLHEFPGFSIGGSTARVNLLKAREEIGEQEGFKLTGAYLGRAYAHTANGDQYTYGIKWSNK